MKCKICGKELIKKQKKFCSKECHNKSMISNIPWNKGKTNVYSKEALEKMKKAIISKETRKKMSEANKGRAPWNKGKTNVYSKEIKEKISNSLKGKKHSKETKRKMRLSHIKYIKKNYGTPFPNYNKTACEYFKKFDEENNTQGRYAVYGDGEYFIEELGYWPDYINFDLKLIIEWDEKYHKKQKEKDIQRQKEIQELYPDFEFMRITEKVV